MATMKEMEDKMTIYYSKRGGEIKSYCTGIQDMGYFGRDKEDFEIIWDYIVVELDNYVLTNLSNFTVDNKALKIKKDISSKYNVANN